MTLQDDKIVKYSDKLDYDCEFDDTAEVNIQKMKKYKSVRTRMIWRNI